MLKDTFTNALKNNMKCKGEKGNMKCPKCNEDELCLYKRTEMVYKVKLNNRNIVPVRKYFKSRREYGTDVDYLVCDNCETVFKYEMDNGKVKMDSLMEVPKSRLN